MKKLISAIIGAAVIGLMVMILFNNKAKSDAKSKRSQVSLALPVSVVKAERQKFEQNLSIVGTVIASNDVMVASETQGRIVSLPTEIGDYKPAGAVIAVVDDELKRANVVTAQVNVDKANDDLKRYEELFKDRAISEQQIESARLAVRAAEAQLTTAQRLLRDTKITAPISGVVTTRPVNVGTTIQNGTVIANIVDINNLKVRVNVAERDVFHLHVGDRVDVTSDVYPGVTFGGRVLNISVKGDEAHTYPVEIALQNNGAHPLKAGMFARLSFTTVPQSDVLMIPRTAVIGSVKDAQVYVIQNGRAKLRSIVVGNEAGTMIQVLKGVEEGEQVVVDGQNNVTDGVVVSIVK